MYELANKKLELIGQAVIELIQFLCDYFESVQPGTNKQPQKERLEFLRKRIRPRNLEASKPSSAYVMLG